MSSNQDPLGSFAITLNTDKNSPRLVLQNWNLPQKGGYDKIHDVQIQEYSDEFSQKSDKIPKQRQRKKFLE